MELIASILFWSFVIGGGLCIAIILIYFIYKIFEPIMSWWLDSFLPALMGIFIIACIVMFIISLFV